MLFCFLIHLISCTHNSERGLGGVSRRLNRGSGKLGELHMAERVRVDVSIVSGQRLGAVLFRFFDDRHPHEDRSASHRPIPASRFAVIGRSRTN